MNWSSFDNWIVLTAALSAMACALPGAFLVLRKLSMMGDAISHTVLPGIALAFLLTGSRDNLPMFAGACLVGVLTALLVQAVHKYGELDQGASMGVIFTSLFAVGLILIRQGADAVDLDPDCVLYGAVEWAPLDPFIWFGSEWILFGDPVPRAAVTNGVMLLVNAAFVLLFWKELKVSSFDPALATSLGINAQLMHYLLMVLVAATCVAAFESVGSILVIAMLIIPGACAYLLTDRLWLMVLMSVLLGGFFAGAGHWLAVWLPTTPLQDWLGSAETSTAAMMGTAAGLVFFVVALLAPRYGVLSRAGWQAVLSFRIVRDDVLAFLFRHEELDPEDQLPVTRRTMREATGTGLWGDAALYWLRLRREVIWQGAGYHLTPAGMRHGATLVRSHRLWELYLVERLGLDPERVHHPAERLEHVTSEAMRRQMAKEMGDPAMDPHHKAIPQEAEAERDSKDGRG